MKRIFFFLLFCLPLALFAEKVSEPRARNLAVKFLQQQLQSRAGNVSVQLVYDGVDSHSRAAQGDERPFYVYNNVADGGFVIISGDDRARPVLGFADHGAFVAEDMPLNMQAWLGLMKEQMEWVSEHVTVRGRDVSRAWSGESFSTIKPVLTYTTADWNQWWPFNKYAPLVDGRKTPSGCVMTATGIFMKYHGWPKQGVGIVPGYTFRENGVEYDMPARKLGLPYDWDMMPLKYDKTASPEAEEMVGRLMIELGTMLCASYAPQGTGAVTSRIPEMLSKYMDYQTGSVELDANDYTMRTWKEKLKEELHANGPLIYSGGSTHSAHAFILDGYAENDFFRFNWGWGGSSNGYYVLFVTDGDVKELSRYPLSQSACFGVLPNGKPNSNLVDECVMDDFFCNQNQIQVGKPFLISAYVIRAGYRADEDFLLSVWLTDENGEKKEMLSEEHVVDRNYPLFSGKVTYYVPRLFCLCNKGFVPGDHIRLYFKNRDDVDWKLVEGNYEGGRYAHDLTIGDAQGHFLSVEGPISFDYNRVSKVLIIRYPKGTFIRVYEDAGLKDITKDCMVTDTKCVCRLNEDSMLDYLISVAQGKARKVVRFCQYK